MNDDCVIYYFSATGNSFNMAQQISQGLGNTKLISMAEKEIHEDKVKRIGFVFPVYYGTLPKLVYRFIQNLTISTDTYCFAVVTMGMFGRGALTVLRDLLAQDNVRLSYGRAIQMPRNYIAKYNPLAPEASKRMYMKADAVIGAVVSDVRQGAANNVKKIKFTSAKLYKNAEKLDAAFFADGNCNGCGLCKKICPVDNIQMVKDSPSWQHHCEHCMACIHWCPKAAIQYGSRTQKRRRYHHPKVTASDLIVK